MSDERNLYKTYDFISYGNSNNSADLSDSMIDSIMLPLLHIEP